MKSQLSRWGVPKSLHTSPILLGEVGVLIFNANLDSYGLQMFLDVHVQQDEWSHQVLLLVINCVAVQSIQDFVVTQEYVAALFKCENLHHV